MIEHPITAILFIIGGTIGFTYTSLSHSHDDNINMKGYASTILLIVLGLIILIKFSLLTSAITILTCSIGVLIFGVKSKRILTSTQSNKPQLLLLIIIGITTSLAFFIAEFGR